MKRVDLLLKDAHYNDYISSNTDGESGLKYCRHGLQHHIDVARIAYILVLEHNDLNYFVQQNGLSSKLAGKEIIYAAGLLHDIAKWKEILEGVDHATYGARLARDLLPRALFSPNEVDIICKAIFEHRNISTNMSFLGERIHRADNLSRVCNQCEEGDNCPKRGIKEMSVASFEY